jgi:hypothetical protein
MALSSGVAIKLIPAQSEFVFFLHLVFNTAGGCVGGPGGGAGALNFGALPIHDGSFHLLMGTFTPGSLTIGGKLIQSLVLDGTIVRPGKLD